MVPSTSQNLCDEVLEPLAEEDIAPNTSTARLIALCLCWVSLSSTQPTPDLKTLFFLTS